MTNLQPGKLYVVTNYVRPRNHRSHPDDKYVVGLGVFDTNFKWNRILPGKILIYLGQELTGQDHVKECYHTVLCSERKFFICRVDESELESFLELATTESVTRNKDS